MKRSRKTLARDGRGGNEQIGKQKSPRLNAIGPLT